eukprot:CAMPEP_0113822740 /NCGR_PEP_ID=MMETSP0328-20130328/2394_1 /TAXON_ID=39455 /ORGANISM="Alexandrium minutum" /LENGTH=181 /DNA_ID=CAMNT_0000790681 /DNA_START=135 /DNA_END=678 /DNA_ORIENTATION=- /assembly_acc=CAM_ASM_000350
MLARSLGATALLLCAAQSLPVARAAAAGKQKPGSEACAELGFGEALRCPTCARLREFLPAGSKPGAAEAEQLAKDCEACCSSDGAQVFAKAILYVCPSQVEVDQDIEDFVKRKASAFSGLTVKKLDGARTTLQLLREGETSEDSTEYVNIRGWKSDEIKDFVALALARPGRAEARAGLEAG